LPTLLDFLKQLLSMNEIIFLIEEDPEGGYVARAIGESIFTQADTIESLRDFIRDAVQCHFEESDRPFSRKFVGWGYIP
jgi:predicted RNase H-like HicB family nuclease